MSESIYFKQVKMFNPAEYSPKLFVYGAGSIGSHLVMGLAKIGLKDIEVYDFDMIEPENTPAQFYPVNAKGLKIANLAEEVKRMTGVELITHNLRIGEEFQPDISQDSIHILAFDNIEARKIVATKLEGFPVWLLDGRIGSFNFEVYGVRANESVAYSKYMRSLEGVFSELECGDKCLWAVNSLISAKLVMEVIRILKDSRVVFTTKGRLDSNIVISKEVAK